MLNYLFLLLTVITATTTDETAIVKLATNPSISLFSNIHLTMFSIKAIYYIRD